MMRVVFYCRLGPLVVFCNLEEYSASSNTVYPNSFYYSLFSVFILIVVTLCAYEAEGPSSSPAGATHPTRCKIGTRACSWEL